MALLFALAQRMERWPLAAKGTRSDGQPCQSWLWSAPAKHSTRPIGEVLERIAFLTELGIDRHLDKLNDVLVRRYAGRVATQLPSVSARIKEPACTVEVACLLRYCLLAASAATRWSYSMIRGLRKVTVPNTVSTLRCL